MKPTNKPKSANSPSPTFTADDLVTALAEALREADQAEGISATDIERATGWHRERVVKAIQRGIAATVVEYKGRAKRIAIDGTMRPVPVYGLVSK